MKGDDFMHFVSTGTRTKKGDKMGIEERYLPRHSTMLAAHLCGELLMLCMKFCIRYSEQKGTHFHHIILGGARVRGELLKV